MQNKHFHAPQRAQKKPKTISQNDLVALIASSKIEKSTYLEPEIVDAQVKTFDEFAISQQLLQNILSKGYTQPTPIQAQAIPAILADRDVIGIADTGTGKTAAFLIPLIEKVVKQPTEKVLIITPTRELAVQIRDELASFTDGFSIKSTLLIGGMNIERQKQNLKENPHFVIGTPGRIKDLLKSPHFSLTQFTNVVLDEADRMVDIGFIHDIKYFISLLPQQRLSLFFSATINHKVKEILEKFVSNPITISIKQKETAPLVEQRLIRLEPGMNKIDTLHDLLVRENCTKAILFGRTKWGIEHLEKDLVRRGFHVAAIHGNKNQNQRQRAITQFKEGLVQILLATDVASRGLDIPDVTHVINYDLPATHEDYIHRIGRTGRAQKQGIAFTFLT